MDTYKKVLEWLEKENIAIESFAENDTTEETSDTKATSPGETVTETSEAVRTTEAATTSPPTSPAASPATLNKLNLVVAKSGGGAAAFSGWQLRQQQEWRPRRRRQTDYNNEEYDVAALNAEYKKSYCKTFHKVTKKKKNCTCLAANFDARKDPFFPLSLQKYKGCLKNPDSYFGVCNQSYIAGEAKLWEEYNKYFQAIQKHCDGEL